MPTPMIVPTTSEVAWGRPKVREDASAGSVGAVTVVGPLASGLMG